MFGNDGGSEFPNNVWERKRPTTRTHQTSPDSQTLFGNSTTHSTASTTTTSMRTTHSHSQDTNELRIAVPDMSSKRLNSWVRDSEGVRSFLSLNRSLPISIERGVFRGDDVGRGGIVSFHSTRPSCLCGSAQLC